MDEPKRRGTKPAPSEFARAVAAELRAAAGRSGVSQAAVQRATGIGRSNLSLYWRGARTMDLDELRLICDARGRGRVVACGGGGRHR